MHIYVYIYMYIYIYSLETADLRANADVWRQYCKLLADHDLHVEVFKVKTHMKMADLLARHILHCFL